MVAVPSDYVRTTVMEAYGAEPSKVSVVPHGFEADLLTDCTPEADLRHRYRLGDGPVLVYPAVTNHHKNHRFLIDLLASTWRDPDLRLVLTGGSGTAEDTVQSATDPRIRRLGRVPAADRNGLLKMAEAMVFPSLYEGFGAPLIEAMALGCPVVASDSTCIPAILDGAGLVLPLTTEAWADALDRVRSRPRPDDLDRAGAVSVVHRSRLRRGPGRGLFSCTGLLVTRSSLRIAVLCPHFAPDTAPTGVVMTRVVAELAALGHEVHVITALPWYRRHAVEPGWEGKWVRREVTPWGSITRVNPFPGSDKRNLVRRAAGFLGFSALAGLTSLRGGRVDAVIAMSPPLTMGLTGWATHVIRRGPLIFNIQDVFPDAAVETGAITDRRIIAVARWLERVSYQRAAAVTVLSNDLRGNVVAKVRPTRADDIRVIPNFVDTDVIGPLGQDDTLAR